MDDIFKLGQNLRPKVNSKTIHHQLLRLKIDPITLLIHQKDQISDHLFKINGMFFVSDVFQKIGNKGDEIVLKYCCHDIFY